MLLSFLIVFSLSVGMAHAQLADDNGQEIYRQLSQRLESGNASVAEMLRLIAVAPDIQPYLDRIERSAAELSPSDRDAVYLDVGMRQYLLGDLQSASGYLVQSDSEARLLGAQALVLLGEYDEAEDIAADVLRSSSSTAVRQQAMTLMGSIYLQSDQQISALGIFEPFRYQPEIVLVPELLYLLIQYELQIEELATPTRYYTVLQDKFPDHPITQVAGRLIGQLQSNDVSYVRMPTPEMLLFPVSRSLSIRSEETAVSETVQQQSFQLDEAEDFERPRGIQVGSFGVRENAEYMAEDIGEAGFPAKIEEQQRDERIFYSVVIPVGDEYRDELQNRFGTDSVEQIHLELRGAGFDGFRVY